MVLPPNITAVLADTWQYLNSNPIYLNGTLRPPPDISAGLLIYDPRGWMSANIQSLSTSYIPPKRENSSDIPGGDFALISEHSITYSCELHLAEGSNETVGALTHGSLTTANRPGWGDVTQTRNYIVTEQGYKGRDALHLWVREETMDIPRISFGQGRSVLSRVSGVRMKSPTEALRRYSVNDLS